MATEIHSDMPIHPGEVLQEELEVRGVSQRRLAASLGRPPQAINEIVRGRKAITAETAIGLERILGISARTWMNLQSEYELVLAYNRQADRRSA